MQHGQKAQHPPMGGISQEVPPYFVCADRAEEYATDVWHGPHGGQGR